MTADWTSTVLLTGLNDTAVGWCLLAAMLLRSAAHKACLGASFCTKSVGSARADNVTVMSCRSCGLDRTQQRRAGSCLLFALGNKDNKRNQSQLHTLCVTAAYTAPREWALQHVHTNNPTFVSCRHTITGHLAPPSAALLAALQ
jgi:hypothetical protein